jgi:hypothetical protein
MMQMASTLLIVANLVLSGTGLRAEPPTKNSRNPSSRDTTKAKDSGPSRARLLESANGWVRVNGEWVHPEGYKFVNNRVIRTTARTGKTLPKPPGKLAQENASKLESPTKSKAPAATTDTRTPAEKAAEAREKNLAPTAAPQTGTHL